MKVYIERVDLKIILSLFYFFPLLGLALVSPIINYSYLIFSFVILIVYLLLFMRAKITTIESTILMPVILYLYDILNTLLQHGDLVQVGCSFVRDIGVFLVVMYWINKGKCIQLIMNCSRMFDIFLIMNAVHMIFFVNGFGFTAAMNKYFLLAPDNSLIFYLIVFIIVHELRDQIKSFGLLRNFLYYAVIFYELYRGEAVTSYFVIAISVLGVLFARKIPINRYVFVGFGVVTFSNIFLIFVRKLSFLKPLFAVVGKDITMSTRTILWDKVILMVKNSFIFGYGIWENMYYIHHGKNLMEAHNMVLSYMLQGGIVLLAFFILMVLMFGLKIRKSNSMASRYLAIGIIAYLLVFLVESPSSVPGFYFLLALSQMEDFNFEQQIADRKPIIRFRQSRHFV